MILVTARGLTEGSIVASLLATADILLAVSSLRACLSIILSEVVGTERYYISTGAAIVLINSLYQLLNVYCVAVLCWLVILGLCIAILSFLTPSIVVILRRKSRNIHELRVLVPVVQVLLLKWQCFAQPSHRAK